MKRVLNLSAVLRFALTAILLLGFTLTIPTPLRAQSAANTGQIVGQVLDPSKAAVASVEVSVRNKDTNYQRSATTSSEGRFAVTQLPLGPYEVTVKAAGLQAATQDVFLSMGGTATANFDMGMQPVNESVEVSAQQLALDTTRPSPKAVLTDVQIHNLPFQGRRVQNVVVQNPAALIEPECSGFSISGQKGVYANVSIDGGDYDSIWQCGVRTRSSSAPSFGLEALQEIQVIRNNFSSEFGRTTGGLITMSTKSGTNQFHGTGYELVRDSSMAARDAFGKLPVARTNQFGGSIGGPIQKDRTFFFNATEFQYGSKPVSVLYGMTDAQRASAAGQALLAVAPEQDFSAISNAQSVITRIDHRFSDTNTFFGRFDFTRTLATDSPGASPLQTGIGLGGSTVTTAVSNLLVLPQRNFTALGQMNSTLSATLLNEARFQFAREVRPRGYQGTGPQVSVTNIGTYGPPTSGSWGNAGFASTDNRYQFADNFSIVSGNHTTKFGIDYQHLVGHVNYNQSFNGAYTFTSVDNLLARNPSGYTQSTGTGSLSPGIDELGLYVQQEWRVLRGVTISPGLRWDAQFNPDYIAPSAPQLRFPLATSIPNDTKMFAPRIGLAWDVDGKGKTVLRAGTGLFYANTYMSIFGQNILFNGGNPDRAYSISLSNTTSNPNAIQNAFQSVGLSLNSNTPLSNLPVFNAQQAYQLFANNNALATSYFDPNFHNPRALQGELGVQREIAKGIVVSEDFAYIHTTGVSRSRNVNLGAPVVDATGRNIYSNPTPYGPQFGVATVTEAAGHSLYRAFTTSISAHRGHYVADFYYTRSWNFTNDDSERGFTGLAYADVNNIRSDYNYSNIDEPQQFRGEVNYSLPFGFELDTTMKFTSGRPITARTGSDTNQDGNNTDRPIINGVMLQRNTFRNNGFKDTSIRLQKTFVLPNERGKLSFTADVFNVFNFKDVWMASTQTYGVTSLTNPSFLLTKDPTQANGYAASTSLANDSRSVQLGVRFQF